MYCIGYYPEIKQVVRFPLVSLGSCVGRGGGGGGGALVFDLVQEVTELLKLDMVKTHRTSPHTRVTDNAYPIRLAGHDRFRTASNASVSTIRYWVLLLIDVVDVVNS
jgi:hypothetical protein